MPDTLNAVRDTCASRLAPRVATFLLVALALVPARSSAEPREIAARVVWASESRAYVATRDTALLSPGLAITIREKKKTLASGELTRVVDGTLGIVALTSGTIAPSKKLDRLRVFAERRPPAPLAMLRVGIPAGARANLAVACAAPGVRFPDGYRDEPLGADARRGVRVGAADPARPWPDTLIVRRYAEAADEEIAFERGEIDVAVFWPGELSARMRAAAPMRFGVRSRGVLAAAESANGKPLPKTWTRSDQRYAALNEQLFAGDLLPWPEVDPVADTSAAYPWPSHQPGPGPVEYTADASLPGQAAIARFLNRGERMHLPSFSFESGLTYLDAPLAARDSLRSEWRAKGLAPLYAIRCPVLAAPGRLAYLGTLGSSAFADLPECGAKP